MVGLKYKIMKVCGVSIGLTESHKKVTTINLVIIQYHEKK